MIKLQQAMTAKLMQTGQLPRGPGSASGGGTNGGGGASAGTGSVISEIMNEPAFQQRDQFNRRTDDAPFFFDSRGSNQFMSGPPHHQRHPRQQFLPHSQFDHDSRRFSMDNFGPPRGFINNRNIAPGLGEGRYRGNINPWAN